MTLAKSSPSFKSPHSNTPREYEPTYGRINKIRHSVLVYRGAATTLAKEIERIYKFSTNGQCKGDPPDPNRSGFLFEYRPVDIFYICRVHSNEFALGELNRHIPSARWGIPNDDDLGSTVPEFQEAGAQNGECGIEMLKIGRRLKLLVAITANLETHPPLRGVEVLIPVRYEQDAFEMMRFGELQRLLEESSTV